MTENREARARAGIIVYRTITSWSSASFQYNLDFRGLSARGAGGSPYRGGDGAGDGDGGGVGADGSKTGSAPGSDPSVWQFGMARRAKGDARRTRVSFLLF